MIKDEQGVLGLSKYFKDVQHLNWPWAYKNDSDQWSQFTCDQCMILEMRFKVLKHQADGQLLQSYN